MRGLILAYLNISEAAFKIAGGITLFLVALVMPAAKRQQRKRAESKGGAQSGDSSTDKTQPIKRTVDRPVIQTVTTLPSIPLPSCFLLGQFPFCQ